MVSDGVRPVGTGAARYPPNMSPHHERGVMGPLGGSHEVLLGSYGQKSDLSQGALLLTL